MSELSSRPTRAPVVYTLEQVATMPEQQGAAFVVVVTETCWQLPEVVRRVFYTHMTLPAALSA
ncbi:hypothetical protein AUS25_00005 [Escherichia coli]|uniref:hypothetical protein n=1 Tax=Escherichia coli TaxID=562 RepID=UPI000774E5E2|nr:hypothetical protein [Escherichia coli]KXM31904.1 hypothetical protein AUS25_00005 [Escherichia coli]